MSEIFAILNAGGIFMYGILTTSIVALSIIAQRVFNLYLRYRLDIPRLQAELASLIRVRDFGRAAQVCSGPHPLEAILREALMRGNRSEKEIRRGIEATAVTELARFRRGTATLPQLANLATLLGLVGTIHGLIISFAGMQGADAATRQAALSKGVAVAFYNTFFGLSVATVTVVGYLIVSSKQGKEVARMEATTAQVIDQLLTPAGAGSQEHGGRVRQG